MSSLAVPIVRAERTRWLEVVDCGKREGIYAVRGLRERRLCTGLTRAFEAKYAREIRRAREDKMARLRKEHLQLRRRK